MEAKMARDIQTIRNLLMFFAGLVLLYLLKVLSHLLIPLFLAMFIAMLLQPIMAWLERKKVPFGVSLALIWTVISAISFGIGTIVFQTGNSIYHQKDKLLLQITNKLLELLGNLNNTFGLQLDMADLIRQIPIVFSKEFLLNSGGDVVGFLGSFTGIFSLMLIYLIIMLGGILKYENYLRYLGGEKKQQQAKLINSFEQVKKSIATYIRVKFIMSLFTGIGTYIVCLLFHIDFALFWGFLAFVLNFLPTVGSIAGVVPPALMGIIQLDTLGMVGLLIFVLFLVQTLFGNILEPIFMGKGVALNTIVVILGLLLWGYLWGFYGMLLSVPLMVTVKVILSNVEGAGFLVRLLGTEKAKRE
jgi:predicted PurR-regulated permease PerM